MFTPLFYGTVNQLLVNVVPFIVMIFTKKVMITSLQKEYSTESVIYTYEYSLKVS